MSLRTLLENQRSTDSLSPVETGEADLRIAEPYMNFRDWLDVKFTDEETLSIEKEAHNIENHECAEHVARVCIMMLKQTRYQSKLLEQAVNRIGYLEMEIDNLLKKGRNRL